MNIRDLEYVVALADKGNFGLAAKQCNVSQPALSIQVKKLEEYLGIKLFERSPQGVLPTENAFFVIANARLVLEKTAQIKQHARYVAKGQRPKLITLGIIPTIAPYYLPRFFNLISGLPEVGDIRWQIVEEKTPSIMEKFDDGTLDAAIMVIPPIGIPYDHRLLFEEDLFLAVHTNHPLSERKNVTMENIGVDDWLLLEEGHCLNIQTLDLCNKTGVRFDRNNFRASSLETLRHMVAHKSGVTLIPEMARQENDGVAYVSINDATPYTRAISLVWDRKGIYAQTVSEMADYLVAKYQIQKTV